MANVKEQLSGPGLSYAACIRVYVTTQELFLLSILMQ